MKKYLLLTLMCMMCVWHANAQEFVNIGGHILPVSSIKKITPTYQEHSASLSVLLKNDKSISLYVAALEATGCIGSLKCYTDPSYGFVSEQARLDSCYWTNDDLCIFTDMSYDNVAYPDQRYYNFTAFMVPDAVLAEKYGITDLDGLRAKAKELYDPVYPEDAEVADETDRRNSLNRFISYHILNRWGTYYTLTAYDNNKLANNFNRRKIDIADWYETLMPHSLMKFSFPSGTQAGLYINRRGVQSREDERGVYIRGAMVEPSLLGAAALGINGAYHYIDDIAAYDEQTQKVVLDERMRINCTTLSPDFMTRLSDGSTARGHVTTNPANDGLYGRGSQGKVAANNTDHAVGFKPGFVRNFEFDEDTHLHVSVRTLKTDLYQGDAVIVKGPYDLKVKLPSLPAGKYEVRLGTMVDLTSLGVIQFYIDDIPQGEPCDMRQDAVTLFGYKSDAQILDKSSYYYSYDEDDAPEEEKAIIAAYEKEIRALGWMKGPNSYIWGENDSWGGTTFRNQNNTVRKIIGTFTTDGKSDHYLRLQQMMESGGKLDFDYIELVPESVYDNAEFPETLW